MAVKMKAAKKAVKKSDLKALVLKTADALLEANADQLNALLLDLEENGSDSDHGLHGDLLAQAIVEAAQ